jgi:hypothetical protein
MYYDANFQHGTILTAEILTPIPQYEGLVRMKADVIQQVDENNLYAIGAAFTTSRLAVPRYWLQSDNLEINRQQRVLEPRVGDNYFDSSSGDVATEDEYFATSRNNRIYVGQVPVFAWPRYRTSLDDPSFYLQRLRLGNDRVFGAQIMTGWDMFKLLGVRDRPRGVEWIGILDYLSDRGLGVGSEVTYARNSALGIPGRVRGEYDSWFIDDDGLDTLGRERVNLVPEEDFRGRAIWRHFHRFAPGFNFRGEFGWISDRNFLESFFEREWDTSKDATTGLWLERNIGTQSYNLIADFQINDFFTQTSWWPRLDHFQIGRPLWADRLVWHSHSQIGYARMGAADPPPPPAEFFDPLAWEADVEGVRAGTRQQLDFPATIRARQNRAVRFGRCNLLATGLGRK